MLNTIKPRYLMVRIKVMLAANNVFRYYLEHPLAGDNESRCRRQDLLAEDNEHHCHHQDRPLEEGNVLHWNRYNNHNDTQERVLDNNHNHYHIQHMRPSS